MSKDKDTEIEELDSIDSEEPDFLDNAEWSGLVYAFGVLYPQSEHKSSSALTRKQKLAAYAVSLGWKKATISKLMGNVHRKTIENWLKEPEFVAFVNACSYVNPIAKVNEYIKNELINVTKVVRDIAMSNDPNIKKETKLDAAKSLMKQVLGNPEETKTITIRDLYGKFDQNSKRDITTEEIARLQKEEDDKTH